jgi:uncharacterized damage-inducible protein DinB
MERDEEVRKHTRYLLRGGGAHVHFDEVIAGFPAHLRNKKVYDLPYTAWQLLEHMRIAQWDILEFSRNPEHVSPNFPEGYWPSNEGDPDEKAWNNSVQVFRAELGAMQELAQDPDVDILAPIAHGSGQTILREALLLADHNAYHLGQMIVLRRLLGCWPR